MDQGCPFAPGSTQTLPSLSMFLSHRRSTEIVDDRARTASATEEPPVEEPPTGSTGTGLDDLVEITLDDPGLAKRVDRADVEEAAAAADTMNAYLIEAIVATGIANDGTIDAADVRDVSAYLAANHFDEWAELHGDDGAEGSKRASISCGMKARRRGSSAARTRSTPWPMPSTISASRFATGGC
ncbi:hypothetical protein Pan216_13200 [Planctomycetes bacterium Pan216]|uniref:Uncharacterized protein n=1 Tax=Kolteria novifilia TaxID=2527975 RepID=A0A518B0G8_9BACT|nr:hypothetical protein Pan216_13200 [Planctomycetes bacterium Pan216]